MWSTGNRTRRRASDGSWWQPLLVCCILLAAHETRVHGSVHSAAKRLAALDVACYRMSQTTDGVPELFRAVCSNEERWATGTSEDASIEKVPEGPLESGRERRLVPATPHIPWPWPTLGTTTTPFNANKSSTINLLNSRHCVSALQEQGRPIVLSLARWQKMMCERAHAGRGVGKRILLR